MFGLLRVYLYWSVLWGALAHPVLGLRDILPMLLSGMDLLVMVASAGYVLAQMQGVRNEAVRRRIWQAAAALTGLVAYGSLVTVAYGGSVIEGAKYLAALCRPMLLLMALCLMAGAPGGRRPSHLLAVLRMDLFVLVTVQLFIAGLQWAAPELGAAFIPSLSEQQSGLWALAEGDVSGMFPNSIDLAYFLVAAYMVICQPAWSAGRAPSVPLTVLMLVFVDATGSLAATVCLLVLVCYLYLRCMQKSARLVLYGFAALSALVALGLNLDTVTNSVTDKVDNMMLSRLGLIFVSIPSLASTSPQVLLLGSGTDFSIILTLLNSLPETPLVFTYDDATSVINDVFWAALLLSLGLPATLIYVQQAAHLFRNYIAPGVSLYKGRHLVAALLLVVLLAGLLNQILLVRSFVITILLGLLPLAARQRGLNAQQQARAAVRKGAGTKQHARCPVVGS